VSRTAPQPAAKLRISRGLLRSLLAFVFAGASLAWFGVRELRLSGLAKAEPQTLTCRALQDQGPGDNAHVRMTDFLLLSDSFAVERKDADATSWDRAWIPAVPLDGEYAKRWVEAPDDKKLPPPGDMRVLVQLRFGSKGTLMLIGNQAAIQGMVINDVDSMGDDVAAILRKAYPGLDPHRCWVLEADRAPRGAGAAWWLILGGVALVVGAVGAGFLVHRAAQKHEVAERQFERRRARARAAAQRRFLPKPEGGPAPSP
jgi:hypothetical protein